MYECDLHSHSCHSDGNDTYQELIDHAAQRGLKVLAITDHDIPCAKTMVAGGREIGIEAYGLEKNVVVFRSIEFSCDTDIEDVHIVALGCDLENPFFGKEYQDSITSKIDGYKELCKRLTDNGLPIDWSRDILLSGQRKEDGVQRKMIFEAMAAKGYAKSWNEAKLLVKNTPAFEVKRNKPDPAAIIRGIHASGGIAVLAHPYLIVPKEGDADAFRTQYIERLIDAGLDGIEACYPYSKTSYDGKLSNQAIEERVRRDYGGRLDVISGGSDYHNDGKKGVADPRDLGECGITWDEFVAQAPLRTLKDKIMKEASHENHEC